jgi:radical SAM protein with 4Fe4S-binding SPASM domain
LENQRLTRRYSLNPRVILRSEPQYYNTYAAFDYGTVRTELLSEDEHRILEHISVKPSDASEISKETDVQLKKCERFLNRMFRLRFAEVNVDNFRTQAPERAKVDSARYGQFILPFLSAPTSVDLFITSRCNLNCVHCFSSTEEQTVHELSVGEVKSVLDQLEKLGILQLRINGGEPLLHPQIDEMLMTLRHRRLSKVMLTNGTLLDEEKVRLLKESGVTPTVSLDDSNAEGHDLFRGVKGSYEETIEALKLLHRHEAQYGINCCLHEHNLHNHKEIIDLAVRHGASRITFLDLVPSRRMKNNAKWIPSYNEYLEVLPDLMLERIRYSREIDVALDTFLTCQPLKESVSEARRGYVCCQAGRNRLVIGSNGSIYPCNLVISDPRWEMGNICSETIADVWFSKKWSFFRGGVKTSDLRECRDCKDLMRCRDFHCRLHPYLDNGDLYGPSPGCGHGDVRNVKEEA